MAWNDAPPTKEELGTKEPTFRERLSQGLQGAGKTLDAARGVTTGPAIGSLLELASGKPVYNAEDVTNAVNPTNLKTFPDVSEMMKRAGVKNHNLSEVLPGYAPPGSPRWMIEKGGAFDPSVGGALNLASDPLNWLSLGSASAAKAAAQKGAAAEALASAAKASHPKMTSALEALNSLREGASAPAEALTSGVEKVPGAGKALTGLATAPSSALDWLGKKLYQARLEPIEHEGVKYGKKDVADALYQAGAASPANVSKTAQKAIDTYTGARNAALESAGEQGGKVSMSEAMTPLQEALDKIRKEKDPNLQPIADTFEEKLKQYLALDKETPGVPAVAPKTTQVPTGVLDSSGNPLLRTETAPGAAAIPAVPAEPISPLRGSAFKSSASEALPNTAFDLASRTKTGQALQKKLAGGLNQAVITSAGEEGPKVQALNAELAKLLSTRKAQAQVSRRAAKEGGELMTGAAGDSLTAGIGSAIDNGHGGAKALLVKKALDSLRYLTTPAGYAARSAAEGALSGPAIDALIRKKLVSTTQPNPWESLPTADEGDR